VSREDPRRAGQHQPHVPYEHNPSPGPQVADAAVEQLLAEVTHETQPQPQTAYPELHGTGAIVTGGATGIGRAIVLELARHGMHIAFNYLDEGDGRIRESAERTAEEARVHHVTVIAQEADVRKQDEVAQFVAQAEQMLDGLHILVNNAGIARDRALWRMDPHEWQDVVDTNLTGAFHMIRATAPLMAEQGGGRIVNISSINGIHGMFGQANYAAAKAGLIGLTKTVAREYGQKRITCNAIAPGLVLTEMALKLPEAAIDGYKQEAVMKQLPMPQDIADAVTFLLSDAARYVTAQVIKVDAGQRV
jgi:NAD(P)-dependent dehydrogenase (short-subunit alcohol dehydrogenase family)